MIAVHPWLGGKRKYGKYITSEIQKLNYKRYFEPFFGSGAVFFQLNIHDKQCYLSDISNHVIDFWHYIQNTHNIPQIVQRLVDLQQQNNPEFYKQTQREYNNDHDPLKFLYITRQSYGGFLKQQKNKMKISSAINPCYKNKKVIVKK